MLTALLGSANLSSRREGFEQDDWMTNESGQTALAALDSYLALRRMNLALCRSLTPAQRATT